MDSNKKIVRIIRKSNDLVEGKYHFNMWETRVFTKMLTLISKDDEDFKEYRIFLKDVVQDFDLKDKNSYAWIKKGAEGLAKKEIRVIRQTDEGEKEFLTHIAVGVESFTKNGNYVDISFHPKMKPFLLQLQTQFLMYDVDNVIKLQSFYSIRIYELLKQYERIGKRTIKVKELKEMLGIQDKYPQYGHLKSRIILKAKEDIAASTDITFDFTETKKGRQVDSVTFIIKPNIQTVNVLQVSEKAEDLSNPTEFKTPAQELYELLANFPGAMQTTVVKWLLDYDFAYIRSRIAFVANKLSKGEDIKNPMGLLQTLMKQEEIVDPYEEQTKIKQAETELRKVRELDREAQERVDVERKNLFEKYRAAMLVHLQEVLANEENLGSLFLKEIREKEPKPLNIQLALTNYKRLLSFKEGDAQEVLFNFEAGGSYAFALEDWLCGRFPIFKKMQGQYFRRLEKLS